MMIQAVTPARLMHGVPDSWPADICAFRYPSCYTGAVQIGNVYMEQGDLEAALSTYMEALENSPDNPDILTTLGITFLRYACSRSI